MRAVQRRPNIPSHSVFFVTGIHSCFFREQFPPEITWEGKITVDVKNGFIRIIDIILLKAQVECLWHSRSGRNLIMVVVVAVVVVWVVVVAVVAVVLGVVLVVVVVLMVLVVVEVVMVVVEMVVT